MTDLAPCPRTPNCVSTKSADPARRMAPIPFGGTLAEARERLLAVLAATPGATVVTAGEAYVKAEFRTRLLRFVDDVDLVLDAAEGVIHFRSASRVGHWDLGANRRRMEALRRAYERAAEPR